MSHINQIISFVLFRIKNLCSKLCSTDTDIRHGTSTSTPGVIVQKKDIIECNHMYRSRIGVGHWNVSSTVNGFKQKYRFYIHSNEISKWRLVRLSFIFFYSIAIICAVNDLVGHLRKSIHWNSLHGTKISEKLWAGALYIYQIRAHYIICVVL